MRRAISGGPCLLLAGLLVASGCAALTGDKLKCEACRDTSECRYAYWLRYCRDKNGNNKLRCRNLSVTGVGWCRCPDD